MNYIDLETLSEAEIIQMFGPAAQAVLAKRSKLDATSRRLDDSQRKLKDSEQRLKDANERLKESNSKLKESDDRLKESRIQQKKSDDRLKKSERMLKKSDDRLKRSDDKLKDSKRKLEESEKKLKKKEAELAEANRLIRQLLDAIDSKNYKLLSQLKERFAPGTRPDADVDEEYTEAEPRQKEKKKVGRKAGTKNGDNIDLSKVEVVHETRGSADAGEKPRQTYKLEVIPERFILHIYDIYGSMLNFNHPARNEKIT